MPLILPPRVTEYISNRTSSLASNNVIAFTTKITGRQTKGPQNGNIDINRQNH